MKLWIKRNAVGLLFMGLGSFMVVTGSTMAAFEGSWWWWIPLVLLLGPWILIYLDLKKDGK